jgi:hypothetical protein
VRASVRVCVCVGGGACVDVGERYRSRVCVCACMRVCVPVCMSVVCLTFCKRGGDNNLCRLIFTLLKWISSL